ncbi:SCO2400 family protein [Streptomyces sp. NPDC001514]
MDYCHQCRRHLNGALACAGCGTPAEELRHHNPAAPADDVVIELGGAYDGAYDEDRPPAGRRRAPAQGRRAARRRASGARRRRKRGRKVLIGTVGLALAAGALSLTELARESVWDDGASVEVREQESVEVDDIPDPTSSDEPASGPSEVSEPPTTSSAAARPGTDGAGRGSGRPTVASSSQAAPSASSAPTGPTPSSDVSPSGTGAPGDPSQSSSAPPPPLAPTPTPSPTETCTWFLFFCA